MDPTGFADRSDVEWSRRGGKEVILGVLSGATQEWSCHWLKMTGLNALSVGHGGRKSGAEF